MIYLYVKRHRTTGLLYFGKTTKRNPFAYLGSGKYWLRHLKKHSVDIETLDVWGFDDIEECEKFALTFSKEKQIVESKQWANLRPENGRDGGYFPGDLNPMKRPEVVEKLRAANLRTNESRGQKTSKALTGRTKSPEHKARIAEAIRLKHEQRRTSK